MTGCLQHGSLGRAVPGFRSGVRGPRTRVLHRATKSLRVLSAASTAESPAAKSRPGEKKGFVEEMRFVAMKLHTKDQAPKEGGKEASEHPMRKWQPTRQGYLNFLAESKLVYDTLEQIVAETSNADLAKFTDTGLERSDRLSKDIAFFREEFQLEPSIQEDGPGKAYSSLLQRLADEDPQAFLSHFYNFYFAHTAGGRMIGTKVASMILDGRQLEFYKYNGDYKPYLEDVRDRLNEVASAWSRDQKDHCLGETEQSFRYSSGLLQLVAT